jgi:GNAT superfamily N-acetyltransferase
MSIKIRKAKKADFKDIIRLINELAKFEKLVPPNKKAEKRLFRDAFGKNPAFSVLVAVHNKEIVAMHLFLFVFFLPGKKNLYLEDIFITESKRRFGIGKLFFRELVKKAKKEKCGRMEWCVLDWNKNAIEFYNKLGAKPLDDWIYYRLKL